MRFYLNPEIVFAVCFAFLRGGLYVIGSGDDNEEIRTLNVTDEVGKDLGENNNKVGNISGL